MTVYEQARYRMLDRIATPEEALAFLDQRLRSNDLPEEELLFVSDYFCRKFRRGYGGYVATPPHVPLGVLRSSEPITEAFVG